MLSDPVLLIRSEGLTVRSRVTGDRDEKEGRRWVGVAAVVEGRTLEWIGGRTWNEEEGSGGGGGGGGGEQELVLSCKKYASDGEEDRMEK